MTTVYTRMTHAAILPSTALYRNLPAQRAEVLISCDGVSPPATLGSAWRCCSIWCCAVRRAVRHAGVSCDGVQLFPIKSGILSPLVFLSLVFTQMRCRWAGDRASTS